MSALNKLYAKAAQKAPRGTFPQPFEYSHMPRVGGTEYFYQIVIMPRADAAWHDGDPLRFSSITIEPGYNDTEPCDYAVVDVRDGHATIMRGFFPNAKPQRLTKTQLEKLAHAYLDEFENCEKGISPAKRWWEE